MLVRRSKDKSEDIRRSEESKGYWLWGDDDGNYVMPIHNTPNHNTSSWFELEPPTSQRFSRNISKVFYKKEIFVHLMQFI